MPTRKSFLAAVAAAPLMGAASPNAQPSAAPKPAPMPTPNGKEASALARAFADRMRSFDTQLTEKNLHDIALGIDENLKVGRAVNPKGTTLKNWDEPAAIFEVPE